MVMQDSPTQRNSIGRPFPRPELLQSGLKEDHLSSRLLGTLGTRLAILLVAVLVACFGMGYNKFKLSKMISM